MEIAVTGRAVHVPQIAGSELRGSPDEPAVPPEDAHVVLGRKGLLAKEPATRLAIIAVHEALGLPPGKLTEKPEGASGTAVIVSSNLGNVETVCDIVDTMYDEGGAAVSALVAPNASSNIVASSIALKYGFTGPNVMVCSGENSGLQAVRLASLLLRAGRTHRCIVVGVEPEDPIAERTYPGVRAGAGCVVLEPRPDREPATLIGPVRASHTAITGVAHPPNVPSRLYGAQGIVELAAVVALSETQPGPWTWTVGTGSPQDGYASVMVERARQGERGAFDA